MKNITRLFLLLIAHTALADNLPKELMHQNQPINSTCFFNLSEKNPTVELDKCYSELKNKKVTKQDKKLIDQGYVGFDYDWSFDPKSPASQCYSYYKYLGRSDGSSVIFTLNNGGGTGQFSSLSLVKRDGASIKVKNYDGGDRCNGGLFDVKNENQKIIYKVNLTPYDLLTFKSDAKMKKIKAYKDIDACAACCVASATYSRDLNHFDKATLLAINLKAGSVANYAEDESIQACFNDVFINYTKNGKQQLNEQQLKKFTQDFHARCMK